MKFIYYLSEQNKAADPQLTVSELIILDSIFQLSASNSPSGRLYSLNYFREVLETLQITPTDLKKISPYTYNEITGVREENTIRQKSFYNTFLTALKAKSSDPAFRSLLGPLTEILDKIVNEERLENRQFDPNYITVDEFSEAELDLVELVDQILIGLLSYEGYTMLSMGYLSFSFVKNDYIVKSLIFSPELALKQMNAINMYSISSREIFRDSPYGGSVFIQRIILPSILFGTKARFRIRGSKEFRTIIRFSEGQFLSSISRHGYSPPINTRVNLVVLFGSLSKQFVKNYLNLEVGSSSFSTEKNIRGKMAMGNLFGDVLKTRYSVPFLTNWALNTLLNPYASEDRIDVASAILEKTKVWSDLITSYTIDTVWKSMIRPGKASDNLDPTQALRDALLKAYSISDSIQVSMHGQSVINEFYKDNNELIVPYTKLLSYADDIQW